MIKHRFSLGLLALFATMLAQVAPMPALAQGISQKVAVCNPDFTGRCVKPDASGNTPVTGTVIVTPTAAVPSTNGSTTVTTGATYQSVFIASTARRGCTIQNPTTATEILNVRVKSVAVFTVPIGGTFNCGAPGPVVVSDLIEVTAATTGHAFTAISQ